MSISELELRLARIERANRLYRLILLAVAISIAAMPLAGFRLSEVQDIVRAKKLVILDDAGKERIVLGFPGGDQGPLASGLFVRDDKGTLRAAVAAPEPDIPGGGGRRSAGSGLIFYDATGRERGGHGTLDDGTAVCTLDGKAGEGVGLVVWPNSTPALGMWDPSGRKTPIWMSVSPSGEPGLYMRDTAGKSRIALEVKKDNKSGLTLLDPAEKASIHLLTGPGKPDVGLK